MKTTKVQVIVIDDEDRVYKLTREAATELLVDKSGAVETMLRIISREIVDKMKPGEQEG